MKNLHLKMLAVLAAAAALSLPAKATIVPVESGHTDGEEAYDTDVIAADHSSGLDLIAGKIASVTNSGNVLAGSISGLTDGLADTRYTDPSNGNIGQFNGDTYFAGPVVFTYNLTGSATGYSIAEIQSTAGYYAEQFINQDFTISVATTTQALHVIGGPFINDSGESNNDSSTLTTLNASSGFIATHVTEISFSFTLVNGPVNLRELDVLGTPTVNAVPEPATWAMLLGGVGFLGFWLRRRKA